MMYIIVGTIVLVTFMMIGASNYQNFQILGISLSPEHAETKEVKALEKKFKVELIVIALVFSAFIILSTHSIFRGQRDFIQLILLLVYILSSYTPFILLERRLTKLKYEKNWLYATQKRLVDISVTREKGKAAPSQLWVWLIWLLMLIPFVISWIANSSWGILLPMLIVPVVMLVLPLSYPSVIRTKTPFVSSHSEISQSYMRRYERINARAFILMNLLVSVYFILVTLMMVYYPANMLIAVTSLIVFLVSIVAIFISTMNKNKELQSEFVDVGDWQLSESTGRYIFGAYYDPDDVRLFVPKRVSGLGMTINVGRPLGKVIMGLIMTLLIGSILIMTTASFDMIIEPNSIDIEAPMYGVNVPFDEIESIELSQTEINGIRTNGYGGQEKSFGYFNLDHYGPVRLFFYSDNPQHIDIHLNDNDKTQWIIFNQQTQEETEELYKKLVKQWQEKR